MKKKMKRYNGEDGSAVYTGDDEIVKYRMGMTDKKEEPKAQSRDFDTTDSETPSMDLPAKKAAPIPKKAAEKLTPKAEEPTSKEESKAAPKSSAFKDSPTAFKDSSSPFKGGSAPATTKEEPKERSLPRGQAKANEGVSSFIKKSMDQIGQEGRDQEARYKATQAKMKESGENLSPRMKAAKASEKAKGMKAGGSVRSSASKRADGCAIRGKTRA
jgi:hypothetical protein